MSTAKQNKPVNDAAAIKAVIQKLDSENLIHFKNGNTLDCRVENLQWVTVQEAFLHKTWEVDADCYLDDEELIIWEKARKEWNGDASLFH
jgi:hypothetical protein